MITENEAIKKMLENYSAEEKKAIFDVAWTACCDGAWLADNLSDDFDDFEDPWDGNHEDEREKLEIKALEDALDVIKHRDRMGENY